MSSELLLIGTAPLSQLYTWGSGQYGQLDNNQNFYSFSQTPVQITAKTFSVVKAGKYQVFALDGNNLWAWGYGAYGTLGQHNNTTSRSSPVQISGVWSTVALGENFGLGIKTDGTLWSWGLNDKGQLGLGDIVDRDSPVQVGAGTAWTSVAAGTDFSMATKSDNTLWTFGGDSYYQLGQGLPTVGYPRSSPVQVSGAFNGTIAAGPYTAYAVKTDGTLWGWGRNHSVNLSFNYYLLGGAGATWVQSNPVQISSGTTWTNISCSGVNAFAIKNSTDLYAWGDNTYGQLGLGDYTTRSSPVQVTGTWKKVFANQGAGDVTYGINGSNALYSWGQPSYYGALGVNYYPQTPSPVLVSSTGTWSDINGYASTGFACVNNSGNKLYGWGSNRPNDGLVTALLQDNGSQYLGLRSSPVLISSQAGVWDEIYTSQNYVASQTVYGLSKSQSLYGWGWNQYGQLGQSSVTPRSSPVLISSSVSKVAVGGDFVIFIKSDKTLWACGNNVYGALGQLNTISRSSPVQVGVNSNWVKCAATWRGAFAINEGGQLYVWGYNASGSFGNGTLANYYSSPVLVGSGYSDIYASYDNSFVIKTDGSLWTAGNNYYNTLGNNLGGSYSSTYYQVYGTYSYSWTKVAPSADHVWALQSDGSLYAWGNNLYGQLGLNSTLTQSTPTLVTTGVANAGCGYFNSYMIKNSNLYSCGTNSIGQLGLNSTSQANYSSPTQVGSITGWSSITPTSDGQGVLGVIG